MTDELKPCPWCGSAPKYMYDQAYDVHCIWCPNKMCGVRPDVDIYVSKESAVENWNQRPVEDALRAKWESVPWEAINNALYLAEEYAKYHLAQSFGDDTDYDAELRAVDEWVRSNAPTKEPAK
jgi:hypothetical protein